MIDGLPVRRIVVLRCNALGDYLMATPALAALRARFPGAELTLLGAAWHERFLTGRPGPVDRVRVLPRVDGLDGQPSDAPPADALPAFLARERERRYDLAVQLHGGGAASNPLVAALGARRSVGLRAEGAPPLDAAVPYRYYQPEADRFLEVVRLAGADGPAEYPPLAVLDAERDAAAALLPGDGPWVALHAGATDPRRRWPAERFAALADALTAAGARPVLVGAADEAEVSAAVVAAADPITDLTGRTDLGTLAAVLERCAVVVANDSGPLHLARAVGSATVGLFWCGNAINAAPATRTRHRPLLSWTLRCPECGVDCSTAGHPHRPGDGCAHRPSFLDQIPLAEVVEEVSDLLGRVPAGVWIPARR
ncbi:glycosyltransferase family 9 protein [Pseudonocardia kunmingensis]|uniref:ADP-heptose:LPS heptosyltransferase n=1 Tax=Pseudonocardia kunmingensis TaxID=630975 RepID=A0A543D1C8_9PSEU|nr:glycosyltransferase family 9 protein [Pseudonocardia kunmingensis]TQM03156.1 ADP-heptose:LPS heptosyltransferase [Pseudonocardia kunmingensis]